MYLVNGLLGELIGALRSRVHSSCFVKLFSWCLLKKTSVASVFHSFCGKMQNDCKPLYPQYPNSISTNETFHINSSQPAAPSTGAQIAAAPATATHLLLGPDNTITVCPFCHASVKTAVRYTITSRTHMAASLCFFVCFCCCIPYCSDSAKNSDHYCPNCQKFLGTYEK